SVSQGPSSSNLSISYPVNDIPSTVNHNAYMSSSSAPQIDYALMVYHLSEFSSPETRLVVLVFQKGDDPIDAINHMMSFLTAVVTSWVTIQPIQGRQNSISAGSSRPFALGSGRASGKQRVLQEEELEFLANPGTVESLSNQKIARMANLSHYGSDNLAEVNNQDNRANHLINQEMKVPSTSKQSTILTQSNTKVTSDSNIISYSQYMNESQYNTVQNLNLPALQDDLILSVIEQLKTQVVNCKKINQYNKQVNKLLTAKLERYINQERVLKEQKNDDKASTSYEPSLEIKTLKHTLSEHLKEKESLEQKITLLKNDFQKEESRNIDRELALEKQETLMLTEESRLKMIEKQNDSKMTEKKVITKPINYAILNQLSTDFETRFVPHTELSTEQAFWSQYSVQTDKPNLSASTTIVEVPKELPKVSMVNSCLKKLNFHLASFDMVVCRAYHFHHIQDHRKSKEEE
nr:hypothetical protein [Tanacetum cinerariifolium]